MTTSDNRYSPFKPVLVTNTQCNLGSPIKTVSDQAINFYYNASFTVHELFSEEGIHALFTTQSVGDCYNKIYKISKMAKPASILDFTPGDVAYHSLMLIDRVSEDPYEVIPINYNADCDGRGLDLGFERIHFHVWIITDDNRTAS